MNILVTAAGAPGTSTLIQSLWHSFSHEGRLCRIFAADMLPDTAMTYNQPFVWDSFQVPPANNGRYVDAMLRIIKEHKISVLFPVSSVEVPVISLNINKFSHYCYVLVSNHNSILKCINKGACYVLAKAAGVNVPEWKAAGTVAELVEAVDYFGYPEQRVVIKPAVSKGSRGMRILDSSKASITKFLNEKPDGRISTLESVTELFGGPGNTLPVQFIVSEYVDGEHYDCMVLAHRGEALLVTAKTREQERGGVITRGELVKNDILVEACSKLAEVFDLDYNISMQFIGDKLIEINPRTSTYIYSDEVNEPYLAVKLAIGELAPEQIREYQNKIPYGRRMIRYYDQVSY